MKVKEYMIWVNMIFWRKLNIKYKLLIIYKTQYKWMKSMENNKIEI